VINAIQEAELVLTDGECIERCLDGDADQFGFLVTRYQRAVVAYLRGLMLHRDRAPEAAQEAFVRAYFNLAKLKKRESFFCIEK
jgi:RNA polymerase sigma-70 factor (ECF subfamily)